MARPDCWQDRRMPDAIAIRTVDQFDAGDVGEMSAMRA
jgi:hypothetical protein